MKRIMKNICALSFILSIIFSMATSTFADTTVPTVVPGTVSTTPAYPARFPIIIPCPSNLNLELYKLGYIDITGKVIIKPQFDCNRYNRYEIFEDGTAVVEASTNPLDPTYGIIDINGNFIIKPMYSAMENFSEGLALYLDKTSDKFGYFNKAGAVAIKPQFYGAESFKNGYAVIQMENPAANMDLYKGLIDKTGKIVIQPIYEELYPVTDGLVGALKDNKYGYLDTTGKTIIPFIYDSYGEFTNGLALVNKDGKFGVIDKTGKIIVPFGISEFEYPYGEESIMLGSYDFTDEIQAYKYNGSWTIFDRTGKVVKVLGKDYTYVSEYKEGLFAAVTSSGICKYLDKAGNTVFTLSDKTFRNLPEVFSEGLCPVYTKEGKLGFIDKTGKWAIQPTRNLVSYGFKDGLAHVYDYTGATEKEGYMDKTGKIVYMQQ